MIVQHFSKHYFYTLTPLSPLVIWIIFHFPSMPMSSPLQCNPVHSSAMWKSSERNKYLLKYAHSKRRGSRFGQKNSERFSSHFWQGLEPQTHTHSENEQTNGLEPDFPPKGLYLLLVIFHARCCWYMRKRVCLRCLWIVFLFPAASGCWPMVYCQQAPMTASGRFVGMVLVPVDDGAHC